MKIERIELILARLPLKREFTTSSHTKSHLDHIILKAYADGLVGWGECASPSDPYYCEEYTETCWLVLRDILIPALLNRPWETIEAATAAYGKVRRHSFAKAGLEIALGDLLGKASGRSLSSLLGGTRREIASGVSLGIEKRTEDLLAIIAEQYEEKKYKRIKLKIGLGHDLEVLDAVRRSYPDMPLMADANSAYTLADSAHLERLDAFGLMMIEQPLSHDDIVDHAVLQKRLKTPICLDESIHTVDHARQAIDLGSCGVINIKVTRVGGPLAAKLMHDHCYARQVPVWIGGMNEFGIGRAANIAVASLPGFVIPGDCSGSDKAYEEDIVDPPIRAREGVLSVPRAPGIGLEVNEALLRRRTLRNHVAK
jgi:O-succinylbenzoate synthase